MFEKLGAVMYRRRWPVLFVSVAVLVLSLAVVVRGGELTTGGTLHALESERAATLFDDILGHPFETTFVAIFKSPNVDARDQAFHDAMSAALDPLRHDARVLAVSTADDAPTFLAPGMVNGVAHAAFALVTLKGDIKHALAAYSDVRALLASDRLEITCTGSLPFTHDLDRSLEEDLIKAEIVSLPLALLVLLYVFRTIVAAALPVCVGALAVLGGIACVLELSHYMDIAQYTINICSLIGLGLAIDYSLFTVSRYREELALGHDYPEALSRAMAHAGRVVAFSGVAVATGLCGMLFFRGSYLFVMGIGGAVVVALSIVFALTFLPALLAVLGPRIHAGRVLRRATRKGGMWHRMATRVMAHPIRVLIPTLAVLLFMGHPFLHLRMGALDVRVLARNAEARRGFDLLKQDFPDQASNRITIALEFPTSPALTVPHIDALFDLSRRIAALPHVRKVESLVDGDEPMGKDDYEEVLLHPPPAYATTIQEGEKLSVGERAIVLTALVDGPPESNNARDVVRAIRAQPSAGDGTIFVGGQTARDLDASEFIKARAPRAIGFIVGVTFVVLFLLLGSVVLPVKALVMNLLSITGSFGALVWVFQDRHLLGVEPQPIDPSVPVLLFCVLFGLSMDYEVLMLSRIRESYLSSGDNTAAVADGLEKTAGLITSAAAIMVAVFAAFALTGVVLLKAVGFGMALAVALDASLVRVLLVPATMRLFGDANWWAPPAMNRLRKRLGLH
jgi:RND superfamily putative drug exporter